MGVLDKAKNAAKHGKLKGEIVLLDREIKVKKQKFGIEISDLIWDIEAKQKALGGSNKSTYLKSLQKEWDVAKVDLQQIDQKMEEIKARLAVAKSEQMNAVQNEEEKKSVMDKAKAVGTEGKRRTKLQLLERELRGRKQQFGIDVYEAAVELVCKNAAAGASGGTLTDTKNQASSSVANAVDSSNKMSFVEKQLAKAAISQVSNQLNKLTVSDQDIEKCICKVKSEVETIQAKMDSKREQIENLKQPAQSQPQK